MEDYSVYVVIWLVCGLIGGLIASSKSQNAGGFLVGFLIGVLLGPLGVILTLFIKPSQKAQLATKAKEGQRTCPHCKEWMRRDASVCPHCQRDSQAWRLHEGRWWVTGDDGVNYWFNDRSNEWVRWTQSSAEPSR